MRSVGKITSIISPELVQSLDAHTGMVLKNPDCMVALSTGSRYFRGMDSHKAALALSVYADITRRWCKVSHTHNTWFFEAYRDGEPRGLCSVIDPDDFRALDAFIEAGTPCVINTETLSRYGLRMKTQKGRQWLVYRAYFDIHPEYRVLWSGIIDLWRKRIPQRSYLTYFVAQDGDDVNKNGDYRAIAREQFYNICFDCKEALLAQ